MKNFILVLATALVVAGCGSLLYAKLDDPSVKVTEVVSAPGLPQVSLPTVTVAQLTFDIGEITVDEFSTDSSLTVNGVTLALRNPAAGTTFAGITKASVAVVAPPGKSDLATRVVASYDQARDGPAGTTLTLVGEQDVNLVPYLVGKTLVLNVTGAGVPPGPSGTTWTADLTIDFHVVAQKNLP